MKRWSKIPSSFLPLFFLSILLPLLLSGCRSDVMISSASSFNRDAYYSGFEVGKLNNQTVNLLGNFLLMDKLDSDPVGLLFELRTRLEQERRTDMVFAAADVALVKGLEERDEDLAARYFLSSAFYAYVYLSVDEDAVDSVYSDSRVNAMQIYNRASMELFSYLRKNKLLFADSFQLRTIDGLPVKFAEADFNLPSGVDHYADWLPSADYRLLNLTHVSHKFGLGVPLIAVPREGKNGEAFVETINTESPSPATWVVRFLKNDKERYVVAKMNFMNPRKDESVKVAGREIPIGADFSTPLAYVTKKPPLLNQLSYMIHPGDASAMEGLYLAEPFDPEKIPVVMVHGLLSNRRTWIQMLNTLQNDPLLRKNYQFWGFTYSSGNPILYSALKFRGELNKMRQNLVEHGYSVENFDRMVLVGHSMGGLICKTAIVESDEKIIEKIFNQPLKTIDWDVSEKQKAMIRDLFFLKKQPYVKRVIFLAVPHRGSDFAFSFIGRFASNLVSLPVMLVRDTNELIEELHVRNRNLVGLGEAKTSTGIDNLDPHNTTLMALEQLPLPQDVPVHSIIGNNKEAGIPAGTDGIVPYESAHLDGVQSELVVKSGHSVQQNALAIQEVRRILLGHLRQYRVMNTIVRELESTDE